MLEVNLVTDRLIIKNLTISNVNYNYLSWLKDKNNSKFIVNSSRVYTMKNLIDFVKEKITDNNILFLGIFDLLSNLHIGNIKFEPINSIEKYVVMGILIGDDKFKGKGIAKEVIYNTFVFLHEKLGITSMLLGVNIKNISAVKAYRKMGFVESTSNKLLSSSEDSLIFELEIFKILIQK